ncbi:MAG: hypothetical protein ACREJN_21530 [Nitrospiraceae bacterium]
MADKMTYIDPADILAEDNSRYGLKIYRLEALAADIVASGGVHTPVEVAPLPKNDPSGKPYKLTAGFYRHAAASQLNESSGAGLLLPAVVHAVETPIERLKRQLSENMERENQSPMDKAIAIAKLMDLDLPKIEIRKIFSVPGGRKGLTMQPASNSYINMHLSFLDLHKDIQKKIHDGLIGVQAAYELTRVSADKRQALLDTIETNRLAQIDKDEADEAKFLDQEKKLSIANEKVAGITKEYEETLKEAEGVATVLIEAQKAQSDAVEASVSAFRAKAVPGLTPEAKKEAEAQYKAAVKVVTDTERALKEAQKVADVAAKEAARLKERADSAAKKMEERAEATAAKRRAASLSTPVSSREVRQSAVDSGVTNGVISLNAVEMRNVVNELALPGPAEKVQAIGKALVSCFKGSTTPSQLFVELSKITGEYKPKTAVRSKGK